jgi:hypothetical protein
MPSGFGTTEPVPTICSCILRPRPDLRPFVRRFHALSESSLHSPARCRAAHTLRMLGTDTTHAASSVVALLTWTSLAHCVIEGIVAFGENAPKFHLASPHGAVSGQSFEISAATPQSSFPAESHRLRPSSVFSDYELQVTNAFPDQRWRERGVAQQQTPSRHGTQCKFRCR